MIQRLRQALARLADPNRGLLLPVLGFPVRIHPTFWLVALVVAIQTRDHPAAPVVLVPALLVSILVHELGHAFAASGWGVVCRITIHGGGGLTEWRFVGSWSWRKTVAVNLAGPGAGFLVAGPGLRRGSPTPPHGFGSRPPTSSG